MYCISYVINTDNQEDIVSGIYMDSSTAVL